MGRGISEVRGNIGDVSGGPVAETKKGECEFTYQLVFQDTQTPPRLSQISLQTVRHAFVGIPKKVTRLSHSGPEPRGLPVQPRRHLPVLRRTQRVRHFVRGVKLQRDVLHARATLPHGDWWHAVGLDVRDGGTTAVGVDLCEPVALVLGDRLVYFDVVVWDSV
jgi:hypothetical protein